MWATTTPVQVDKSAGPCNSRIDARNRIAEKSFIRAAGIAIDDQHALMATHQDLHHDNVHYKEDGAELMGEQAVYMIKDALTHPSETDAPKALDSARLLRLPNVSNRSVWCKQVAVHHTPFDR
jgi:streptomycin 6-kinase